MKLGFRDMYEVSLGADFVSKNEGQELLEHYEAGEKMTTSCCPAFVSLIKKHYPQVLKYMSTTVSPMTATGRLIKAMHPDVYAFSSDHVLPRNPKSLIPLLSVVRIMP